jgi:hypothetical protein
VYSFGKNEILKSEESDWQFLTKETQLSPSDIIRMPPISLLRLKDKDGNFLPVFTGGCELTVADLINIGTYRLKEKQSKHIGSPFDSKPAVDILPTGNRIDTVLNSSPKENENKPLMELSEKELERVLEVIPRGLEEYAKQKVDSSKFFDDRYPNRNLSYARNLFMTLDTLIVEDVLLIDYMQKDIDDELKRAILYSQLLKSVKVKSGLHFEGTNPSTIFDTGLPQNEIKKVTANRNLVFTRNGNLWIRVSMEPADNFILAWYNGNKK